MAEQETPKAARTFSWRWPAWTLLAVLVIAAIGLLVTALWLDSDSGHEYIIEQVEGLAPESGLRIGVGDVDGSIYDKVVITDFELRDPRGRFFHAGKVTN